MLNWTQIAPHSKDLEAVTEAGAYTISFDSLFAGGSVYLFVPTDADDPSYTLKSESVAKLVAENHFDLMQETTL